MDSDLERRTTWIWAVVIGAALMMPILYVLSVGPAIWLHGRTTGLGQDIIETVYYPLEWLHENTFLERPLQWYVEMWQNSAMLNSIR